MSDRRDLKRIAALHSLPPSTTVAELVAHIQHVTVAEVSRVERNRARVAQVRADHFKHVADVILQTAKGN